MSHLQMAVKAIRGQYVAITGAEDGAEASLGIALGPILTTLLTDLIGKCFPTESDASVAEALVDPTPAQENAFKKKCAREARKEIKRKPDKNPTGERISARERNRLRDELADDLFLAMRSTAETEGVEGVTLLVAEIRSK